MIEPKHPVPFTGFRGYVKASVLNGDGSVAFERDWQPNLLLDCGLDRIANTAIADIFSVCVKGTGSTASLETISGTYTLAASSPFLTGTVTRNSGARDFAESDIGKLIHTTNISGGNVDAMISGFTDATHVSVKAVGAFTLTTYSAKSIALYSVGRIAMDNEISRTGQYSTAAGENSTVTGSGSSTNGGAGTRTLNRTFIFGAETTTAQTRPGVYTWSGTALSCVFDSDSFSADDVNSYIFLNGIKAKITAYTDASNVTLDTSHSSLTVDTSSATVTPDDTAEIYAPASYSEIGFSDLQTPPTPVACAAGFTWATTTLTADADTFDSDNVGDFVVITDGTYNLTAMITHFTSTTAVTLAISVPSYLGAITGVTLYTDPPVNIRIALASPVLVYGAMPGQPSQQLKVSYKFVITVSPRTKTALNNPISGWATSGNYVIEEFGTSTVNPDGTTNTSNSGLDPVVEGTVALSTSSTAINDMSSNVAIPNRQNGTTTTDLAAATYVPGSFTQTYSGTFAVGDAVSTVLRTLMLYDPDTGTGLLTYLFPSKAKDNTHTLSVTITKKWGRSL